MKIKICGITTEADGRQAAVLGADAIGLNFFPQSRRHVAVDKAASILRQLPPLVEPVGLFVNEPFLQAAQTAEHLGLRTLQWHGDEHEAHYRPPFRVLRAFAVAGRESLDGIRRWLERCQARGECPAGILVDAHVAGEYGGTGQRAPWELLADFRPDFPLILAGGLTPENVAEAIGIVRPYGVDVSSGVESSPGRKDAEKMRRFIGNAREVAARLDL
jgi:phosphoribosylanthranilate isomerase